MLGLIHLAISWYVILDFAKRGTSGEEVPWIWGFFGFIDFPCSIFVFAVLVITSVSYYIMRTSLHLSKLDFSFLPYPINDIANFTLPAFTHGILGPIWFF